MAAEDVDQGGGGRLFLGDRHVDADDTGPLLVEDRVDGDGGFSGLAVTDDELALAAADGRHGIDRLDTGLHRLVDRLAAGDPGRDRFQGPRFIGEDRPLIVDRLADRVDDTSDHRLADGHPKECTRGGDGIPFLDACVVAQDHDAHRRFFEVDRDPLDAVLERHHLAGHQAREPIHPCDSVAHLEHLPHFTARDFRGELLDFTLNK